VSARKQVLLVEPHSLFRRTLAGIARQLAGVDVHETSSHEAGRVILETQRVDCLLLNLGDDLAGLKLLKILRAGQTINRRDLPTVLLAEVVGADAIAELKALHPQRLMLMPFKVRTAFDVVVGLVGGEAAASAAVKPAA